MDKFLKSLKRKYRERYLQNKEKWPPLKGERFVNLQLVEFEESNTSFGSFAKRDGKASQTKPISYSDLLMKEQNGNRSKLIRKTVVKGNAGMGKTTLCTMLTEQWAVSKILDRYNCVLLLPLREREVAEVKNLADLLKLFHSSERVYKAALEEIEDTEGDDILFIADGWDELSAANRSEDSFLYKLLFGNRILPFASVLVTSRASALPPVGELSAVDQLVEVIGFKDKELHEYIELNFESHPESGQALIKELEEKAHIKALCLTPLNCAIICYLWNLIKEIPHTYTKLYSLICRSKIHRELVKRCPELKVANLETFDSIPQPFNDYLWDICKIAFDALCDNRIVFREEELPQSVFDSFLCFSLIQSSHSLLSTGYSTTYQFVHLAIQEFLAALHFSTFSSTKKMTFFEKLNEKTNDRFMVMLTFVYGLTTESENSSFHVIKCNENVNKVFTDKFKYNTNFSLTCVYESFPNENLIQQIIPKLLVGSCYIRNPHGFQGLCKIISFMNNSSYDHGMSDFNLSITRCDLHNHQLKMFSDALVSCDSKILFTSLELNQNKLTTDSLSDFFLRARLLFTELGNLDLNNNCITYISEPMCCVMTHITRLSLSDNPLRVTGFLSLTAAIESKRLPALENLSLANTLTEDADINGALLTLLFEAIGSNCFTKNINISRNALDVPGMCAVREAFYCLHSSDEESICISIDSDTFFTLCDWESQHDSVRPCNTEFTIRIRKKGIYSYNDILNAVTIINTTPLPIVGLKARTKSITDSSLQEEVPIEVCCKQLLSIEQFSSIKELDVSFINFSGDRAAFLAQYIKTCHKTLVKLDTEICSLSLTEIEWIISFLISSDAKCEHLEKWYLDRNTTVTEDIHQILPCLREFSPCLTNVSMLSQGVSKDPELMKFLEFNERKNILRHNAVEMTGRASASRDWMIIRPKQYALFRLFDEWWNEFLKLCNYHLYKRNDPDHSYIELPDNLLGTYTDNFLSLSTESSDDGENLISEVTEEEWLSHVAEQTDPTEYAQGFTEGDNTVTCGICNKIWLQPTTFKCGHTFCCECILKESSIYCKLCSQFLSRGTLNDEPALLKLELHHQKTKESPRHGNRISDIEFYTSHLHSLITSVCNQDTHPEDDSKLLTERSQSGHTLELSSLSQTNKSMSMVTEYPVQDAHVSRSSEESSHVLEQKNADPDSTGHAQITEVAANVLCDEDKAIKKEMVTNQATGLSTESNSVKRNTSCVPAEEDVEITQHTLDKELEELTEPKRFGIKLNIPQHRLEIIEWNNRNDIIGQKIALFGFIAKNYKSLRISWSSIADALAEMDHKDLASHIRQTHCQNPHFS